MRKKFKTFFTLIFGWIFFVPLAYLIPKKKDKILFIGRDNGLFLDNVKYLYLFMEKNYPKYDISFLTEDKAIFSLLYNHKKILYPSLKAFWNLLRTNILVVDNGMWIKNFKIYLLWNSKKVQLWHGIGLKRIHLDDPDWIKLYKKLRYRIYLKFFGLPTRYQLFLSTNDFFYDKFFKKAFLVDDKSCANYPRNEVIIGNEFSQNYDVFLNSDLEFKNRMKSQKDIKTKMIKSSGWGIIEKVKK